jgi:hypothetical protein
VVVSNFEEEFTDLPAVDSQREEGCVGLNAEEGEEAAFFEGFTFVGDDSALGGRGHGGSFAAGAGRVTRHTRGESFTDREGGGGGVGKDAWEE